MGPKEELINRRDRDSTRMVMRRRAMVVPTADLVCGVKTRKVLPEMTKITDKLNMGVNTVLIQNIAPSGSFWMSVGSLMGEETKKVIIVANALPIAELNLSNAVSSPIVASTKGMLAVPQAATRQSLLLQDLMSDPSHILVQVAPRTGQIMMPPPLRLVLAAILSVVALLAPVIDPTTAAVPLIGPSAVAMLARGQSKAVPLEVVHVATLSSGREEATMKSPMPRG